MIRGTTWPAFVIQCNLPFKNLLTKLVPFYVFAKKNVSMFAVPPMTYDGSFKELNIYNVSIIFSRYIFSDFIINLLHMSYEKYIMYQVVVSQTSL